MIKCIDRMEVRYSRKRKVSDDSEDFCLMSKCKCLGGKVTCLRNRMDSKVLAYCGKERIE